MTTNFADEDETHCPDSRIVYCPICNQKLIVEIGETTMCKCGWEIDCDGRHVFN